MSSIYDLLAQIKNAVYGKDVRDAIHDSIEQCYDDATGTPESIAGAVADIQSYKEQTDASISSYETLINSQIGNLVAELNPDKVVTLWSGTGFGKHEDSVRFSGHVRDYDFLDIYVQESYNPIRVKVKNNYAKLLLVRTSATGDNHSFYIDETDIYFNTIFNVDGIDGNDITEAEINYTYHISIFGSGTQGYYFNDDVSHLNITKVDGIKIASDVSAEIVDIRVGEDGTVYQTAGAAVRGQIADVKADLVELQEEIEGGGSGLTDRQKALFITILRNALYSSNQKSNIDELEESFTNMVLSITATLDLAGNTIYSDDTLDTLRQYLTVKANYDDGTKQVITDYTLAGTLVVPSSTIQVGYRDKTASVTVPVSQAVTKYTITNNLTGVTNSNNSTVISEGNTYMGVLSANTTGYMVTNVSIMVGSTDVTSTAYNSDTNTITIENVQGNITITASEAINPLLPVYELASTMTASGTIDYALFDQEQDWTIVYTMNTPANSGRVSISNLLSNYYGFRIISDYVAGTDTLKIWNGTSNQLNKGWLDGTVAGSQKIVVTHDADGSSIGYWKQTNMKSGHEASGEGSKTLTVGETVTPNNQPFTVTITGDATLSDFKIYKRVLTNEEISEYVGWTVG